MAGIGITVLKRNAPWGPFTPEQIEEGLKRGDFTVNYLAHAPGLKEWLPLGEVLDFIHRQPEPPGLALPQVPAAPDLPPLPVLKPTAPPPETRPTILPEPTRPPILPPPRRELPPALAKPPPIREPVTNVVRTDAPPEPEINLEAAPFFPRAVAFLLDGAIVFLPVLVLTIVAALCIEIPAVIRPISHQARMEEWDLLALNDRRLSWLIVSLGWLYGAAFEASPSGATIGKRWLGLRVVDGRGQPVGFFRAVGRNFGKYLSGALAFIGFLMALFGDRHLALHDRISNTCVVRV